jgi:uncharacterized protein
MEAMDLVQINLLSPVVLAFALGVVGTLLRSNLRLPEEIYAFLSIYLLLAIGLKGGAELSVAPLDEFWKPALATLALGLTIPLLVFAVARVLGRLEVPDAGALAAHYGSVSVVTFVASLTFLGTLGVPVEPYLATLVAILEVPAIVVGLALAHGHLGKRVSWPVVVRDVLTGRSIVLLAGGLAIGYLSGKPGLERVSGLFVEPFQGVLMLFLLHLGTVTARRLRDLRQAGLFLIALGTLLPLLHGAVGVAAGAAAGLSVGGATVLGVLAASASYIAAPAAVRMSLPDANPSIYLGAALGITFPFNLVVGIPAYYAMAQWLYGV